MFVHANSKDFFVLICDVYMTVGKFQTRCSTDIRIQTLVGQEESGRKTFKKETQSGGLVLANTKMLNALPGSAKHRKYGRRSAYLNCAKYLKAISLIEREIFFGFEDSR